MKRFPIDSTEYNFVCFIGKKILHIHIILIGNTDSILRDQRMNVQRHLKATLEVIFRFGIYSNLHLKIIRPEILEYISSILYGSGFLEIAKCIR